jgi:hypothetical protein
MARKKIMTKDRYSILIIKQIVTSSLLLFSFWGCNANHEKPPEAVTVAIPTIVSSTIKGEYFLLLVLKKDNTIWYKYDTIADENNIKKIVPKTTECIVAVLDEVEKEKNIDLKVMENLIVKNDNIQGGLEDFKIIKAALKQKEIFKFRIVTTNEE